MGVATFAPAPAPLAVERVYAVLDRMYSLRPCFVCGADYWCRHREPDVDLAECAAMVSGGKEAA